MDKIDEDLEPTIDFKGIFIPRDLWLDKNLSHTEMILLAKIDLLDGDFKKGCFASNKFLSEYLNRSEGQTANLISDLKRRGYVTQTFFDGRRRGLRTIYSRFLYRQPNPELNKTGENKLSAFPETGVQAESASSQQMLQAAVSIPLTDCKSGEERVRSSDSSSLSDRSFDGLKVSEKTKTAYNGVIWSNFLNLLLEQGTSPDNARKMIGKLIKKFSINLMETVYAENINRIELVDEPYGYFSKLLEKLASQTDDERAAERALWEAKNFHRDLHQNVEVEPPFEISNYLSQFPDLRKLKNES